METLGSEGGERESRLVAKSFEEAGMEDLVLGGEGAERSDAPGRRSSISSMGSRDRKIVYVGNLVVRHSCFLRSCPSYGV